MDKEQAKRELLKMFEGDIKEGIVPIVHTVLRHVSQSGMMRHIDVIYIKDNKPTNLNLYIEKLGLYKRKKDGWSLRVSGCGMDMGFSVVYNLSSVLFKDNFFCIGKNCKSNDHINGDKNYKPHKHSDGGYLLKQEWL